MDEREWVGSCIRCGGRIYQYPDGKICRCDCICDHQPMEFEQWLELQKKDKL